MDRRKARWVTAAALLTGSLVSAGCGSSSARRAPTTQATTRATTQAARVSSRPVRLNGGFDAGVTAAEGKAIHGRMGARLVGRIEQLHVETITVPAAKLRAALSYYRAQPGVRYVERDAPRSIN